MNRRKKVTKEDILEKTTSMDIFTFYLGTDVRLGKTIRSPIRDAANEDRHPSFNIYRSKNGEICFKDFAVEQGTCFDFVMKLYNLSFPEALQRIASDMDLFIDGPRNDLNIIDIRKKKKPLPVMKEEPKTRFVFDYLYGSEKMSMQEEEDLLEYYGQFGIDANAIYHYPVRRMKSFEFLSKEDNVIRINSSESDPVFMYDYGLYHNQQICRFYRPKASNKRMKHLGNAGTESIFGITNIPVDQIQKAYERTGVKVVVICAGQKDAMCVFSNFNIYAISLSSESSHIDPVQWLMLKEIFGEDCRFVSLYDNDKTGMKYALLLHDNYGIKLKLMNVIDEKSNDISQACAGPFPSPLYRKHYIEEVRKYLLL